MVLTAVGWLAEPIIKKVVDMAWQHLAETEELIAELKSFKVPIETADTKEHLKEEKELVNEAKDLLDELDYFRLQKEVKEMNKAEQGNIFSRTKYSDPSDVPRTSTAETFEELKFDRIDMSKRMTDLIKKLKNRSASLEPGLHYEQFSSFGSGIQNMISQTVLNDQQTNSYLFDKIYGRDDQIEEIQRLIGNAKQHYVKIPVIAIVGNGGVGKTTLAQHVFSNTKVKFDKKIWIYVSKNFDEMGLTRKMPEYCSSDGEKFDSENLAYLKSILKSKLKNKKVLLVLDDIWEINNKSEWTSLLASLDSNVAGSVVLVTTRFLSIAKMVEVIDPIIKLDGLDDHSFWSLFKICVFGNDQYDVPEILENFGRRIVSRLNGNPLAAKTVGALFKDNTDVVYWTNIMESEQWMFLMGKDDIIPTLQLRYEYLPIHLKQCFSYCSIFPKNYYFKTDELIYMWMALDFLHSNDRRIEDVGFEYLNILIGNTFFKQVVTESGVRYVIPDLMYDLAQVVSKEEFISINRQQPFRTPPRLCRHLSFLADVDCTIENIVPFQNLSSLVIFENHALKDTINWDKVNRVTLRLLILPYVRSTSYNFSCFIHLRYLKLNACRSGEAKFPVQICRLYHLQVLELDCSSDCFVKLPKEFNNLINLQLFIAPESLHSQIDEVGKLKHLQETEKVCTLVKRRVLS